ncbi:MAG TPA: hypothetical protein VL403_18625 [Candidatus Kryptonia bacterium]|nr:hypothetical protein [Candidatus Kryptonia bacterium]
MSRRSVGLLATVLLCGCLWRSYESILDVHLTVLLQMTDKLHGMADSGHTPTAADMVEFSYPAQRGREFLRAFRSSSDRPSYQRFGEFLDRYEAMVKQVDAARVTEADWRSEPARLQQDHDALKRLAADIRRELAQR